MTVDGRTYEVEIEEIGPVRPEAGAGAAPTGAAGGSSPRPAVPPAVPAAARKAPAAAPERAATGGKSAKAKGPAVSLSPGMEGVTAPLPGVILAVKVGPGHAVKAGQVLFVLEAMKMENEITTPVAGTVAEVKVAKGASVAVGELLAVIAR